MIYKLFSMHIDEHFKYIKDVGKCLRMIAIHVSCLFIIVKKGEALFMRKI